MIVLSTQVLFFAILLSSFSVIWGGRYFLLIPLVIVILFNLIKENQLTKIRVQNVLLISVSMLIFCLSILLSSQKLVASSLIQVVVNYILAILTVSMLACCGKIYTIKLLSYVAVFFSFCIVIQLYVTSNLFGILPVSTYTIGASHLTPRGVSFILSPQANGFFIGAVFLLRNTYLKEKKMVINLMLILGGLLTGSKIFLLLVLGSIFTFSLMTIWAATAIAFGAFFISSGVLLERLNLTGRLLTTLNSEIYQYPAFIKWQAGLTHFYQGTSFDLLFGYGIGHVSRNSNLMKQAEVTSYESSVIQILIEFGLLGLMVWLLPLFISIYSNKNHKPIANIFVFICVLSAFAVSPVFDGVVGKVIYFLIIVLGFTSQKTDDTQTLLKRPRTNYIFQ